MDHSHTPIAASPEEIDRAQTTWARFVRLMQVCVVATIVLLALMAFFLV